MKTISRPIWTSDGNPTFLKVPSINKPYGSSEHRPGKGQTKGANRHVSEVKALIQLVTN